MKLELRRSFGVAIASVQASKWSQSNRIPSDCVERFRLPWTRAAYSECGCRDGSRNADADGKGKRQADEEAQDSANLLKLSAGGALGVSLPVEADLEGWKKGKTTKTMDDDEGKGEGEVKRIIGKTKAQEEEQQETRRDPIGQGVDEPRQHQHD